MQNIFLKLILLLSFFKGISQEEKKIFRFEEEFSFYYLQNNNFGTNFLAKANKPIIGFGAELVLFKVYDFGLGFGIEKGYHKVTDNALGGNIENTNSTLLNLNLHYYRNIGKKFRLNPFLSFGELSLKQRTDKKHFGTQRGTNIGFGSNFTYSISKEMSIYTGLKYNFANLKVNTSEEFINFFDHTQQIQLKFGILLH